MGHARGRSARTTTSTGWFGTGPWSGSWFEQQAVALLAVILLAATLATPALQQAATDLEERITDALTAEASSAVPEGLTAEEWADIQAQIAALQESQTRAPQVTVEPIAAPTLRLGRLDEASFATAGASFALNEHLVRLGTVSVGGPIAAAAPEVDGDRVIYDRGTIEEWFVETELGIEQGWTIAATPAGVTDELVIEVSLGGTLVPVPVSDTAVSLVDEAGNGAAVYSGLLAWDANGLDLPAAMTVVGDRIAITVDVAGATYPVTVDPVVIGEAQYNVEPNAAQARHGSAIDVDMTTPDGPVAVIAAPGSDLFGAGLGMITVLRRDGGGNWNIEAQLQPDPASSPEADDRFGASVSVEGRHIAVGAPGKADNGTNSGAVYVYEYAPLTATWGFEDTLYECQSVAPPCGDAPGQGGAITHRFGSAVSFASESDLVIGAEASAAFSSDGGIAYVFRSILTSEYRFRNLTDIINNPTLTFGDRFGASIDADVDRNVVIGAPAADGGDGAVYWATIDGTSLLEIDALAFGAPSGAGFGGNVAVGEDLDDDVVIGATSSTGSNATIIWVVEGPNTPNSDAESIVTTLTDTQPSGGIADIDFDGATFLQGIPRGVGSAIPSVVSSNLWLAATNTLGVTDAYNTNSVFADETGVAVAMAGADVMIGEPGEGQAKTGRTVAQVGQVLIRPLTEISTGVGERISRPVETAENFFFGGRAAVDGNVLAVSAIGDDNEARNAGAVYIYTRPDSASPWLLSDVVNQPGATADEGDRFGFAVDVRNGYVAVAAPGYGVIGNTGPGAVYVYEQTGPSAWALRGTPITTGASSDEFAFDMGFGADENHIIIGARDGGVGNGAVYESTFGADWSAPSIIASAAGQGENFGSTIATAVDATTLWIAVGDSRDLEFSNFVQGGAFTVLTRPIAGGVYTTVAKIGGDFGLGSRVEVAPNLVVTSSFNEFGDDTVEVFGGPTWSSTPIASLSGDQFGSFAITDSYFAVANSDISPSVDIYELPVSGALSTPDHEFAPTAATDIGAVMLDPAANGVAMGQSSFAGFSANEGTFFTGIIPVPTVYGQPSVAIDGDWGVVGVPADDIAYVYENTIAGWELRQSIVGAGGTSFGAGVAITDRAIVIGAPGSDAVGTDNGEVFQYYRSGSDDTFALVGSVTPGGLLGGPTGVLFGLDLDILLNGRMFVGAPGTTNGTVYYFTGARGPSIATADGSQAGAAAGDEFGYSVAATSNAGLQDLYVAGAPGAESGEGRFFIYELDTGSFQLRSETAGLPATLTAGDRLGEHIAVARTGFNRLVVVVTVPIDGLGLVYDIDLNDDTPDLFTELGGNALDDIKDVSISGDSILFTGNDQFNLYTTNAGSDVTDVDAEAIRSLGNAPSVGITGGAIEGGRGLGVKADGTLLFTELGVIANLIDLEPYESSDAFQKLGVTGSADEDNVGRRVEVGSEMLVVSAPNARNRNSDLSGELYVYRLDGSGDWLLDQVLEQPAGLNQTVWGKDMDLVTDNLLVVIGGNGGVAWYTRNSTAEPFAVGGTRITSIANAVASDGEILALGIANQGAEVIPNGPTQWATASVATINRTTPGAGSDVAVDSPNVYLGIAPPVVEGTPGDTDYGLVENWEFGGGTMTNTGQTLQGGRTGAAWSDAFGARLDLDGPGELVVGAPFDLDRDGAVYVFDCFGGVCDGGTQLTRNDPAEVFLDAEFGTDVAINSDSIIVGARLSGNAPVSSNAFVYTRTIDGWEPTTLVVDPPDSESVDAWVAVGVSDTHIVLGGPDEDSFGAQAGAAVSFRRDDGVVNPAGRGVTVQDPTTPAFARSVAIDGDTMVVGDPQANDGRGGAYVFGRSPAGVWTFTQEILPAFGVDADGGQSVAIEGDTLVIGAPFHNGASVGGIAVYERSLGMWAPDGGVLTSPAGGGWLGWDVAIEGSVIVAGAPQRNAVLAGPGIPIGSPNAGGLSIFEENAGTWGFARDLNRAPDAVDGRVGWSVDIFGGRIWSVADFAIDEWTATAHVVTTVFTPRGSGGYDDIAAATDWLAFGTRAGNVHAYDIDDGTFLELFDFVGAGDQNVSVDIDNDTIVAATEHNRQVQVLRNDGGGSFSQVQSGSYDQNGQIANVAYDGATVALGIEGRDNVRGQGAGSVFTVDLASTPTPTPDDPVLQFELGLGDGQANSINVAPGGIAIADIDAALLAAANAGESTLTASPLGRTEIEDAPLAQLNLGDTPIPQAILSNPELYNLPLIDVELDRPGGWTAILEGTPFADRPLQDITLGEVLDATVNSTVAGQVASLPIGALDVNGTPIGALPIGALVLGDTPIGALPLGALGLDVCGVFLDAFPAGTSCTEIEAAVSGLSVTQAALQGLPIGALPIGALPIGALPIGALPLADLPLGALQLQDSPIGALPIGALPIGALGLDSIPIGALPIGALPIGALPLGALGLDNTPIGALPLGALELNGIPIGALDVQGAPIGALPIGALPIGALVLGDEQLSSLPVPDGFSDWCQVLADIESAYDCSVNPNADDESIVALGLRGVPIGALPIGALPIGALDVDGTPIGALPIGALPLGALPIGALPIGALPIGALPIGALPIGALPIGALHVADLPIGALDVQGSPIGALPIGALPIGALGLESLPIGALPIGALPIGALPIGALEIQGSPIGALPIGALDVLSSPIGALPIGALPIGALPIGALDCTRVDCDRETVGDAVLAGAIDVDRVTFDSISSALGDISLGDLAPYFLTISADDVEAAVDASPLTLADLLNLAGITLGDLPLDDPRVSGLVLGDLDGALGDVSLSDLASALGLTDEEIAVVLDGFDIGDLENFGDITVGDTFADQAATARFELDTLGPFLGLIDLEQMILAGFGSVPADNGETLGDVVADPDLDLGALTLADLIGLAGVSEYDTLPLGVLLEELRDSGNLLGFVLADLLSALVGLEDVAFGSVDFTEVEAGSLPLGTVPDVQFRAGFRVTDTLLAQSVVVDVELPATATYVPGTAIVDDGTDTTPLEPVVDGNTLQWTVFGVDADEPHVITFDVRPEVTLGSTALNGRGRVIGTDTTIPASAAVTVAEGLENNDYPATTVVVDDTVYLTYISTTTDLDVFEVTVRERDRLAIQLSNLSADLDLVVYGVPADTAAGAALTATSDEAALDPITNPDATEPVASEVVDDFPRLDQRFPSDGLQFIEVSNASGTADELIVTEPLAAGTYYVQVHGANGARNQQPATLQIQTLEADSRPPCSTLTDILGGALPAAAPGLLPTDLTGNTLFLVNEQRLEQLYGQPGRADVMNSLEALVLYLEANTDFGLDPIVIPVEAYAGVASAYAAWDDPINADDACDPEVANEVVSQIIANAVDPIRDQLDHVIIVGGDDIIPMARLQDATTIANEYDYRTELVGDLNGGQGDNVSAFTATFWESRYLSDDPYGEAAARSLGDRFLYVPDVSLGRLVESPDEIAAALDHYVTFNGTIDMNTAAVLGYDFLTDSSAEIASDLTAAGLTVDDDLADGIDSTDGQPWDRVDAEGRIVPSTGSAADLISFNAHFDHYRALPAAGDQVPGFLDNVETSAIADALPSTVLEGTLLFSAGCHGGLSVSDIQIGLTNLDWAQAASQADALWIGNTGFGYGDTETIAYTEQLMALFAEEVVAPLQLDGETAPTTIGQAFTVAKNRFIAENAALSVYDEKASMEAVFYGLPIYRSTVPAEPAPAAPINSPSPDATGTPSLVVTVDTAGTLVSTPSGGYYAETDADGNEEVISVPGRPVQPKTSEDVSVVDPADTTRLNQVAHGGLILDMTSTYLPLADPVIASVVVDESGEVPEPAVPDSVFPVRPIQITQSTTATGQRQTLSIATGQYRPGPGIQRLDDDIDVAVYYADPSVTDFNAPRIGNVESAVEDGLLTVTLNAADDSNGVDRVYVLLAENPGSGSVDWEGFDLARVGTSDVWAGSVQLGSATTQLEFIVQAKDGVGNVGYANNKASGFNDDTTPDPEPPAPVDLAAEVSTGNLDPNGSGWFTGDVVITVTSDGEAGYSVDGAPFTPITSGDSFTVTGDGIHTVEIETPAGERIDNLIRIDTTGAPSFTAGTPVAFGSYSTADNNVYDYLCTDPSLVSCDASVGGVTVGVGSPLPTTPGAYVLTVATIDALGNDATYTVPFDVVAPLDNAPEITLFGGPAVPQLISDGVQLEITFADGDGGADDYTIEIDWGDLDEDETPGSSTTCSASSGSPTTGNPSCAISDEPTGGAADGLVTASFVYDEPGVYAIEATITDGAGNVDTSLFEFAVVYDPAAGRVSGAGWFWSGPEAYAEEEPWGGPAYFGYRARYRNGDETPRGTTKLRLVGEFFFRSTSYDYLIVNDTMAVAEGSGRIGRDRGYRFRVQGIDNGRHDFFQITIWDEETGDVVYDNGLLYDEGDRVLLGGIRVKSQ